MVREEGPSSKGVPDDLRRFLGALFEPADCVLVRPIETWTEGGRKRSRVVYKEIRHRRPPDLLHPHLWKKTLRVAADERANLFFGVCPRFKGGEQYDLAWQVRTVRV